MNVFAGLVKDLSIYDHDRESGTRASVFKHVPPIISYAQAPLSHVLQSNEAPPRSGGDGCLECLALADGRHLADASVTIQENGPPLWSLAGSSGRSHGQSLEMPFPTLALFVSAYPLHCSGDRPTAHASTRISQPQCSFVISPAYHL